MRQCSRPGAAPEPGLLQGGAAVIAAPGPGGAGTLAARLATIEAGIRDDRHRQPANVVEAIARLWSAGASVSAIVAETGVSPHIVRDRLRRAGVLGSRYRDQRRHVREVLERQGARLIAAYEAGAAIQGLADGAGISGSTLREYLAVEGVAVRRSRGQARAVLEARGAEVIAAYEAGRGLNAVASGIGVSGALLREYLVDHGVAIRTRLGRAWDLLEPRAPELIAAYEAGATLEALAAGAGVSEATVGRFITAQGVTIRDRHQRAQDKLERRRAELVEAYQDGETLAVLAARAGVSSRTLSAFLVAQGVRLRHDHGWYRRRRRAGR
ncbi:MAG: hypothetical protein ABFC38_00350 [Methanospirillum sp.]